MHTLQTGGTPLMIACQKGHLEVAKNLVNHKANVNCQDEVCRWQLTDRFIATYCSWYFFQNGQTALHAASAMDHPALVELVVKSGAMLDIQTKVHVHAVICHLINSVYSFIFKWLCLPWKKLTVVYQQRMCVHFWSACLCTCASIIIDFCHAWRWPLDVIM